MVIILKWQKIWHYIRFTLLIERIKYFESLPEKGSIIKENEKLEEYKA